LLHPKSKWKPINVDDTAVDTLARSLSLSPLLARMLVSRGLTDERAAEQFLHPSLDHLHDPFLLSGMAEAVARIQLAIEKQEHIRIYGDYDVDGVSSTSLLLHVFRELGALVDYYIPDRFTEGYGLHQAAIQLAKDEGVDLLITVDTGITAVQQVAFATEIGLDIIITDHHEPSTSLPQALAVINPKQPHCNYPDKQLAGVGVAAKLATALLGNIPERWLDLVALGTIADLVPLTGENRIFATFGLERLNRRENVGLAELITVSGIDKRVDEGHVGFSLGPRINAIGRLASAKTAVELLTTVDREYAKQLAAQCNAKNIERQSLVDKATEEAIAQVERDPMRHRRVIVVYQKDWHLGVVGIVASRLVDRYYRPTFVLGYDEKSGFIKGSARSIRGFALHRALTEASDFLSTYGGHEMAAGLALPLSQLPALQQKLTELAEQWLTPADYIRQTEYMDKLALSEVQPALIDVLRRLAPFGIGNPIPLFQLLPAEAAKIDWMGGQANHLKIHLQDEEGNRLEAIRFRCGELADQLTVGATTEIIGELQLNEWNGRRKVQILIRDLAIRHLQIFDWRSNRKDEKIADFAGKPILCICSNKEKYVKLEEGQLYTWYDELPADLPFAHVALLDAPPSIKMFQAVIQHLRGVERLYVCFGDADFADRLPVLPSREICKRLYQTLWTKRANILPLKASITALSRRLGISTRVVTFLFQVFAELEFIRIHGEQFEVVANPPKRALTESKLYQQGSEQAEVLQMLVYSPYRQLSKWIKGA
jgi:single-stranded-DNA-specific exonuclease